MNRPFEIDAGAFWLFRSAQGRWGSIVAIIVGWLVLTAFVLGALAALLIPVWPNISDAIALSQANGGLSDAEGVELLRAIAPVYGVLAFVGLFAALFGYAIVDAAWLRLTVRSQPAAGIPFRLGGDELRLVVVRLALFAIHVGVGAVFLTVMGAAIGVGAATEQPVIAGLGGVFAGIAWIVAWFWISVKLAPAGALTIRDKRIAIGEAWSLTKGMYWPLFGILFIAVIIWIAMSMVAGIVGQIAIYGSVMGPMMELATAKAPPDPSEVWNIIVPIVTSPSFLIGMGVYMAVRVSVDALGRGVVIGATAYPVTLTQTAAPAQSEAAPQGEVLT